MGVGTIQIFDVLYVLHIIKDIKDALKDMPEEADNLKPNFHEFALNSGLFKGRADFYFSYLKAEKLSHAVCKLSSAAPTGDVLDNLVRAAAALPGALARFSAGEIEEAGILADIFELLSLVRLCVTQEMLAEGNGRILAEEYQGIAHKIHMGKHASPFIALEELSIPPLRIEQSRKTSVPGGQRAVTGLKDIRQAVSNSKGHTARASEILGFVRKHKKVSVKDIVKVIRGVSEKTIQRELQELIREGLVRKEGERRWSQYSPT